ncbi:MAG: hypothetical protein PHN49_09940 [Candidatus Omnitrophica bacterium]|nr:hypothetical protein [Candidatus Omnitrophota bacterium]MDD5671950.1 hypothetical protein [Candidatus Omnitrophota bacterium]
MAFGHKKLFINPEKLQTNDRNWAIVILKPLRTEIRDRLTHCISDVFAMSSEEAKNVVANTPIILLDSLPQSTALKVKEHFRFTGAEMFLTNDTVVKSKCYRTIWPELPNLAFLHENETVPAVEVKEIKNVEAPAVPTPAKTEKPTLIEKALEQAHLQTNAMFHAAASAETPSRKLGSDLEQWKAHYDTWKETFQGLSEQLERLRNERQTLEENVSSTQALIQEQQKEIQEQKALFASLTEIYRGLQADYQKGREEFEQHLSEFSDEVSAWKAKLKVLSEKVVDMDQLKHELESAYQGQKERFEKLESAHHQIREIAEGKGKELGDEIERWKDKTGEVTDRMNALEQSRDTLAKALEDQQSNFVNLDAAYHETHQYLRQKIEAETVLPVPAQSMSQGTNSKMAEKLEMLEKLQMQLILDLQERLRKDRLWEEKVNHWDQQLNDLRQAHDDLKKKVASSDEAVSQANLTAGSEGAPQAS